MSILRGGIKHRQNRKPYGIRVKSRKPGKILGEGIEGVVREVQYELSSSRGRRRKVQLVEKNYGLNSLLELLSLTTQLGSPRKQFRVVAELIEKNRTEKLGLRLPNSLRIISYWGGISKRLARAKYPVLKLAEMTDTEKEVFAKDADRQFEILNKNGYFVLGDAFLPVRDPQSGRVVAMILDFGTLMEKKEIEGRKLSRS